MKYTLFTREQVIPKIGESGALNFGDPPNYPAGAGLFYAPADLDIWSEDPADRTVLLSNPNAATSDSMAAIDVALPDFRRSRELIIRRACEAANKVALGVYVESESERRTWPQQRDEATRKKLGGSQVFPTAEKITQVSGESIDQFLQAVWDKILPYDETVLTNIGIQRIKLKAIYSATTVEAVIAEAWV